MSRRRSMPLKVSDCTREPAMESNEAFRQYVVIHLDRHSIWQENHDAAHKARDQFVRWTIGLCLGVPGVLATLVGLIKVFAAAASAGVLP